MITSITFLHHGIHWTLYFNIVYNKISILLNHLRTSSFAPSVNFSTNRLIFVRPLRAVILFIWEQLSRPSPLYEKREWHNGRSSLHPLQCRHIGGLSCWFLFLLRGFSSGAPVYFPPKKNQHFKFNSNWKQWTRRTTSWYVRSYFTIIIPTIIIITQWSNFVNAKQTGSFSSSFGYLAR